MQNGRPCHSQKMRHDSVSHCCPYQRPLLLQHQQTCTHALVQSSLTTRHVDAVLKHEALNTFPWSKTGKCTFCSALSCRLLRYRSGCITQKIRHTESSSNSHTGLHAPQFCHSDTCTASCCSNYILQNWHQPHDHFSLPCPTAGRFYHTTYVHNPCLYQNAVLPCANSRGLPVVTHLKSWMLLLVLHYQHLIYRVIGSILHYCCEREHAASQQCAVQPLPCISGSAPTCLLIREMEPCWSGAACASRGDTFCLHSA